MANSPPLRAGVHGLGLLRFCSSSDCLAYSNGPDRREHPRRRSYSVNSATTEIGATGIDAWSAERDIHSGRSICHFGLGVAVRRDFFQRQLSGQSGLVRLRPLLTQHRSALAENSQLQSSSCRQSGHQQWNELLTPNQAFAALLISFTSAIGLSNNGIGFVSQRHVCRSVLDTRRLLSASKL